MRARRVLARMQPRAIDTTIAIRYPQEHTMATVHTPVTAAALNPNHAATLVLAPVTRAGLHVNHAEAIVRTPVVAQALSNNHAEGLVGR
jgi:hypothetical protein